MVPASKPDIRRSKSGALLNLKSIEFVLNDSQRCLLLKDMWIRGFNGGIVGSESLISEKLGKKVAGDLFVRKKLHLP